MASDPPKVFISYSHDSPGHEQGVLALAERLRQDGVETRIDRYVNGTPAEGWPRWMENQLDWADFVLLLCTETYYRRFRGHEQPEKGRGVEWEAALVTNEIYQDRSFTTKFVPVLLSPSETKFIPRPLLGHTHYVLNTEENNSKLLAFFVGRAGVSPGPLGPLREIPQIEVEPLRFESSKEPGRSMGKLHHVPDLPPHYLPREADLARLKQKLSSGDASGVVSGRGQAVGLQGMGGIGKTVLATALARDSQVRQTFPDGIYWLTIGQKPNLLDLQNRLLGQLTGSKEMLTTQQEAKDALCKALEGRPALVVVDDVWAIDHVGAFFVTAPPARLLITTRNNEVLVGLGAEEHRVDVLSSSDALKMLAEWTGKENHERLAVEAAEVAKECGYLPLALAAIGAMIRLKPAAKGWNDALTRLKGSDLAAIKRAFPFYPYPDLLRALEVSIDALDEADRDRYLDLAVFPDDQRISELGLRSLWNLDELDTRDCMSRLAARSLARFESTPFVVESGGAKVTVHPRELIDEPGDDDALILHDLLRDFIRIRRKGDIPAIHARLVESWGDLMKLKDGYAWSTVVHHLSQCGRNVQLKELLLNFRWLEAKLRNTDPEALLKDFDNAPPEPCFRLIAEAIRHSMKSLKVDRRQLAGQLVGRLLASTETSIQDFLGEVAKNSIQPWIRPLRPSLDIRDRPIAAVAIAPDGRRVVLASSRTLRVLDLGSGQTLHILEGHKDCINAVAITPDGRHAVSASRDTTLRVWDINTGQILRTLKGHTSPVQALAITPDGTRVVTGSGNEHLFELFGFDGFPRYIRIGLPNETAGGSPIRLEPSEYALRVWDLRSGQLERILNAGGEVNAIGITPDGSKAVSASKDVRLWELKSGATVRTLKSQAETVAVTPDGCRAVLGGWHGLAVWDLDSGRIGSWLEGIERRITALRVRSDGRYAISVGQSKTLSVWDLSSLKQVATFTLEHPLLCCAVAPDGRTIVIGDGYGRAHFLQFVEADETKP